MEKKREYTLKDRIDMRIWSIMKSSIQGARSIVDKTMNVNDMSPETYADTVLRIGLSMFITKVRDYRQFYFEDIFSDIPVRIQNGKGEDVETWDLSNVEEGGEEQ